MANKPNPTLTLGIDRHESPWVSRDGDDGDSDALGLSDPIRLLAGSLAACLAQYVARFLDRRDIGGTAELRIRWSIDQRQCRIDGLAVEITLPTEPPMHEVEVLRRMLHGCPIHKALEAVPVDIVIQGPSAGHSENDITHASAPSWSG